MTDQPSTPKNASGRDRPRRRKRLLWVLVVSLIVLVGGICAIAGLTVGYLLADRAADGSGDSSAEPSAPVMWTCSMHPRIQLPKKGKCPICFMDLIPLEPKDHDASPRELKMSPAAMALADIRTQKVERRFVTNSVRMVGKVDYDETKLVDISSRVPGRLDRLYVDYTGVTVRKGDHLVYIYSPELVVAQKELLQAHDIYTRSSDDRNRELALSTLGSVEEKLRLLGVLDEQIEQIKQRGTPSDHLTIYAPASGIVVHKDANEGMYVKTGTRIYTIADLSRVWVYLDAYESDLPWIRYGQEVQFTTESFPGEVFTGRIAFIDPVLNEKTRTVKVRVNVPNEKLWLKPGMFVRAVVQSRLAAGGRVLDASLIGKWISPMHPEVVKDGPGQCDVCGMDLVPAESLGFVTPERSPEPPLVIPASAPLITGKRAVVYVKLPDRDEPTFEGREVILGYRAGNDYVVRHGLKEGELVVTAGNFKIDAALQIQANPSMMSPPEGFVIDDEDRKPLDVSGDFRLAVLPLLNAYLAAAKALAADDRTGAQASVGELIAAAKSVDANLLDEKAHTRWTRIADRIVVVAYDLTDAEDRDTVRTHFGQLSEAVVWLVESFGHAVDGPLVQMHCDMANDYEGGDWLQSDLEVANPYFGSGMLGCGKRVKTFESQAPLRVPDSFRRQFAPMVDAYLQLQEALAADRLPDAVAAWQSLHDSMQTVDPSELGERETRLWAGSREQLEQGLSAVPTEEETADIEKLRKHFGTLSITMLDIVDRFGHTRPDALSKAFCPMAFKNKGAAWLQSGEQIANPYFGAKMLRCGSINRTFAAADAQQSKEVQP